MIMIDLCIYARKTPDGFLGGRVELQAEYIRNSIIVFIGSERRTILHLFPKNKPIPGRLGADNGAGSLTLLSAHCIWFFAYIRLAYVTVGTLYLVFRIHLARLHYWRHIVFGFSHTFGPLTLPSAHCIRFSAYISPQIKFY